MTSAVNFLQPKIRKIAATNAKFAKNAQSQL